MATFSSNLIFRVEVLRPPPAQPLTSGGIIVMSGQISISGLLIADNNALAGYLETSGLFPQNFPIDRAADMVLQVYSIGDNAGLNDVRGVNVDLGGNGDNGNDGGGSGRGRRVRNSFRILQQNIADLTRRGSRVFSSNGLRRRSVHQPSHEANATEETTPSNSDELNARQRVETRDSATQTDESVGRVGGGMSPPFSLNYDRNLQRLV